MHIRIEDISSSSLLPSPQKSLPFGWRGILLSVIIHILIVVALSQGTSQKTSTPNLQPAIQALLWFPPAPAVVQPAAEVEAIPTESATLPEIAAEPVAEDSATPAPEEVASPEVLDEPASPPVSSSSTSAATGNPALDFNAKRATQGFLNQVDRRQQEALAQEAIREFRFQSTHPEIPHWQGEINSKREVEPIAVNCDSGLNETLAMIGKFTGARVTCSERSDFDFAVQQRLGRLKPLNSHNEETKK